MHVRQETGARTKRIYNGSDWKQTTEASDRVVNGVSWADDKVQEDNQRNSALEWRLYLLTRW